MKLKHFVSALLMIASFAGCLLITTDVGYANDWLTGLGAPSPSLGTEGDLYLDLDTGNVFHSARGTWVEVGLLRAGALGRGPGWLSGSGAPTSGLGGDGDLYLDITTGRAYKKNAGTWLLLASLLGTQGPQGVQGAQGPQGPQGAPVPIGPSGPTGPTPAFNCQGATINLGNGGPFQLCSTIAIPIAGTFIGIANVQLFVPGGVPVGPLQFL